MWGEALQPLGRPHSQVALKHIRARPLGGRQWRFWGLLLRGLQPQCQFTTATLGTREKVMMVGSFIDFRWRLYRVTGRK